MAHVNAIDAARHSLRNANASLLQAGRHMRDNGEEVLARWCEQAARQVQQVMAGSAPTPKAAQQPKPTKSTQPPVAAEPLPETPIV